MIQKRSLWRCTYACIFLLVGLLITFAAKTATQSQVDNAWSKGLSWLAANQTGEGYWTTAPGLEVITASFGAEAFRLANVKSQSYSRAIAFVGNTSTFSTDTRARQIIALYNAGMDVSSLINTLISSRNSYTVWGAYANYEPSFPDTSLTLDAIKITATTYADVNTGLGYIVGKQNTDGGWPHNPNELAAPPSRIIPTSHNILTLVRHLVSPTYYNNAVTWLKTRQKINGSFGDETNGTIYETAIAYAALVATVGPTDVSAANALDYLIQQQQANGSWANDPYLTALVLQVLPLPSTTPTINQDISLITGNGQGAVGTTTPNILGTSAPNAKINYMLPGVGAGNSVQMISGALPSGMVLYNNGMIGGRPISTGTFTFAYKVYDAAGNLLSTNVAQITIEGPPAPNDAEGLPPEVLDILLNIDDNP